MTITHHVVEPSIKTRSAWGYQGCCLFPMASFSSRGAWCAAAQVESGQNDQVLHQHSSAVVLFTKPSVPGRSNPAESSLPISRTSLLNPHLYTALFEQDFLILRRSITIIGWGAPYPYYPQNQLH